MDSARRGPHHSSQISRSWLGHLSKQIPSAARRLSLPNMGLAITHWEMNRRAAELARQAADQFSTSAKPRFVAGSMGPTTKAISVTGGITFPYFRQNFLVQARGLLEGGVDVLLLETCQDTRNIKAGVLAIQDLSREIGQPIPLMISVTIEPMGTMLAGQNVEALWSSLDHGDVTFVGSDLRHRSGLDDGPRPHARPDGSPRACRAIQTPACRTKRADMPETPDSFAEQLEQFWTRGG